MARTQHATPTYLPRPPPHTPLTNANRGRGFTFNGFLIICVKSIFCCLLPFYDIIIVIIISIVMMLLLTQPPLELLLPLPHPRLHFLVVNNAPRDRLPLKLRREFIDF